MEYKGHIHWGDGPQWTGRFHSDWSRRDSELLEESLLSAYKWILRSHTAWLPRRGKKAECEWQRPESADTRFGNGTYSWPVASYRFRWLVHSPGSEFYCFWNKCILSNADRQPQLFHEWKDGVKLSWEHHLYRNCLWVPGLIVFSSTGNSSIPFMWEFGKGCESHILDFFSATSSINLCVIELFLLVKIFQVKLEKKPEESQCQAMGCDDS